MPLACYEAEFFTGTREVAHLGVDGVGRRQTRDFAHLKADDAVLRQTSGVSQS